MLIDYVKTEIAQGRVYIYIYSFVYCRNRFIEK